MLPRRRSLHMFNRLINRSNLDLHISVQGLKSVFRMIYNQIKEIMDFIRFYFVIYEHSKNRQVPELLFMIYQKIKRFEVLQKLGDEEVPLVPRWFWDSVFRSSFGWRRENTIFYLIYGSFLLFILYLNVDLRKLKRSCLFLEDPVSWDHIQQCHEVPPAGFTHKQFIDL